MVSQFPCFPPSSLDFTPPPTLGPSGALVFTEFFTGGISLSLGSLSLSTLFHLPLLWHYVCYRICHGVCLLWNMSPFLIFNMYMWHMLLLPYLDSVALISRVTAAQISAASTCRDWSKPAPPSGVSHPQRLSVWCCALPFLVSPPYFSPRVFFIPPINYLCWILKLGFAAGATQTKI